MGITVIKLSLLIVEVVIELKICRASISGTDPKLINVSITAENMVNMGQDECLYYHGEYALHEIRENKGFHGRIRT